MKKKSVDMIQRIFIQRFPNGHKDYKNYEFYSQNNIGRILSGYDL